MSRANQALSSADNKTAGTLLNAVTRVAPSYAEGWHARATMEAAAGNDSAAMLSLQRVVQLNPRHFTAHDRACQHAGRLWRQGRRALQLYRKAPWRWTRSLKVAGPPRQGSWPKEVEGQAIWMRRFLFGRT